MQWGVELVSRGGLGHVDGAGASSCIRKSNSGSQILRLYSSCSMAGFTCFFFLGGGGGAGSSHQVAKGRKTSLDLFCHAVE